MLYRPINDYICCFGVVKFKWKQVGGLLRYLEQHKLQLQSRCWMINKSLCTIILVSQHRKMYTKMQDKFRNRVKSKPAPIKLKTQITLNFFPSSSILYSVTVFIFPLMVSLGDGSVPGKKYSDKLTLWQKLHRKAKTVILHPYSSLFNMLARN